MNRTLTTLLVLTLVCAGTLVGQDQTIRRDLAALTAPAMAGRGIGTPGGELAIRYVASRMQKLGLARMTGLEDYIQRFETRSPMAAVYDSAATRLTVQRGGREFSLALGSEALPFRFSPDGSCSGEVVFAGYGLVASGVRNDFAGLDLEGKIALVLRRLPADLESQLNDKTGVWQAARQFQSKIAAAQKAGARGFLLVDHRQLGVEGDRRQIATALYATGAADIPAFWITRTAADRMLGGTGRLAAMQACHERGEQLGRQRSTAARVEMRLRMAVRPAPLKTANVIGLLRGRDKASEFVVIGAHHDHLGDGKYHSLGQGEDEVGRVHPGADDNASGVCALLAIAERLVALPAAERPRRSILFVSFGAEELYLRGSRHFLKHCPVSREQIVAMLNLDMVGRATSQGLQIHGVGSAQSFEPLVAAAKNSSKLDICVLKTAASRSDHWAFMTTGIPSLFFHSGLHEQYHRPSDIAELVEIGGVLRAAKLIEGVLLTIADAASRPVFERSIVRRSYPRPREKK